VVEFLVLEKNYRRQQCLQRTGSNHNYSQGRKILAAGKSNGIIHHPASDIG